MKFLIACDNTFSAYRTALVKALSAEDADVHFVGFQTNLHIPSMISQFETHENIISQIDKHDQYDAVFVLTTARYDNNYFFEGLGNFYLISLSDWNYLTNVPIGTGAMYMIASIIIKYIMGVGQNHEENCGCVNDFWWDKTGVDAGMRAAFVCTNCEQIGKAIILKAQKQYDAIKSKLDVISTLARSKRDITDMNFEANSSDVTSKNEVFLCHNSVDKPDVRKVNDFLKTSGVKTWFDEDKIVPGDIWQDVLETAIETIEAVAVFVGSSGKGPWQEIEMRCFLQEFASRGVKIIPILIGDVKETPDLPLFLKQFQYLDLRGNKQLDAAILITVLNQKK